MEGHHGFDTTNPHHLFFRDLLFPHVQHPSTLFTLRRMCRYWRDMLMQPRYWAPHVARVCARLPSLRYTFERSSAPAWRVYAMLMAQPTEQQQLQWAGVVEAMITAAHRYPERIERVRLRAMGAFDGAEVVYKCGLHIFISNVDVDHRLAGMIGPPATGKRLCIEKSRAMYRMQTWRPLFDAVCTCPNHALVKRMPRQCYPDALTGPFRCIVRNETPGYAGDQLGGFKSADRGSYAFFED